MVATARHLVCLTLLLYVYVNKAKATRPYRPVVYKTRFTASPSRLFQSFLEYLLSQICPQPVPHSFLFCSPWGLFPKNPMGRCPTAEPSASLLVLPNPEILWCQRALWVLQPHHVPSRGLEITSPPTLNLTSLSEPLSSTVWALSLTKFNGKQDLQLQYLKLHSPKGKTGARGINSQHILFAC